MKVVRVVMAIVVLAVVTVLSLRAPVNVTRFWGSAPSDVFYDGQRVGSISVLGGRICLRPRKSFKASLYTKRYEVPIEIPIAARAASHALGADSLVSSLCRKSESGKIRGEPHRYRSHNQLRP